MAIPDYQTLMLPVLQLAAEGEAVISEAERRLADQFALTQAERDQMLPSGRQRVLYNRIQWAKSYLTKAGLVTSPRRGRFTATDQGRALLARHPERIDNATLMEYPEFLDFFQRPVHTTADGGLLAPASSPIIATIQGTPEESIEEAVDTLQASLRQDLLDRLLNNSPSFFERVIVDLLVAMGYGGSHRNAAAQLGRVGDGGVDGIINEDILGLDRVYVQAKRYTGNAVGRPEVQAFVGSLVGLGASKGVFVTTSTFSPQAVEYTRHLSQRVILIDGQRLADFMIEHNVGVRVSRRIEFKRVDEDFFTEEE
ncbi:MAG: restriction endonuclease [Methanobacterium sp.]|nr:restriction endonuclease [Methanobacterium sp.]